jgi:elongator complex protein 2
MAVSSSRKLIATACKATSEEHAVVRLYDTERFQPYGSPLAGHNLTVTGISFSPDDRYVLTVSRDRAWRLYELQGDGLLIFSSSSVLEDDWEGSICWTIYPGYEPVAADKSHGRIIWDCSWAPDSSSFATASRDKTVSWWHAPSFHIPISESFSLFVAG